MSDRLFALAAAGLICVATVALATLSWGGFYYQDDFLFLRIAHDSRLTVDYLAEGAFGHFFPGFRAAFWAQDRTVRLDHDVAVVAVALVHLAALVAMCRLLVLLFGRRTGTLALLGMFAFSSLWLSGYLWWVSALQVMPAMLLTIVAIDGYVRYLAGRRRRHLVITAGALAISLLFYEKPAQLAVLLPLLTVLAFSSSGPRAWLRELAGLWRMWAAFGVVFLAYAVAYVSGDFFVETTRADLGTFLHTIALAWHQAFVPSLLGGPVDFIWNGSLGLADPSPALTIIDQLVLLALVALSLWRRPAAWRGWIFLLVPFAINTVVIAYTRSGLFGPGIGRELKYLIDVLPFAIIGVGIAFMALQVGPRANEPPPRRTLGVPATRLLLGAAAVTFLTLFAISAVRVGRNWHDGESARFARNFQPAAARERPLAASTVYFDGEVSGAILAEIFRPFQRHSVLLELFDTRLRYAGQATRTMAVDREGRITPHAVPAQIALRLDAVTVDSTPYPRPRGRRRLCLPDDGAPHFVSVPLAAPLPAGRPYLRLVARASRPATVAFPQQAGIEIGIIDPRRRVSAFRLDGSGRPLYVPLEASGAKTLDLAIETGGQVCLERGHVGMYAPVAEQ